MFDASNDNRATAALDNYFGRADLVELAMASNARIAELHHRITALNQAQADSAAEQQMQHRQIRVLLERAVEEGRRFDAIEAAMDEATQIRFWGQVGIPARA